MSWKSSLCTLAATAKPENLPPNVCLSYTEHTITAFDKFAKARFHFLLLPRPSTTWFMSNLKSLKNVLRKDKNAARDILTMLKAESKPTVDMIQDEMRKTEGCTWKIWCGFHAVPSMDHLHLHIISSDLESEKLKNKKHYNSFHPSLGFFLHLDDVLSWFELPDSEFEQKTTLSTGSYENRLRTDLTSWRTRETFKTLPKLKEHLHTLWDAEVENARQRSSDSAKRKRKMEKPTDCIIPPPKKAKDCAIE